METFFALLALCEGNPPVPDGSPSQRPVTRSFDVFFAPVAVEQTNRDAGDLRCHRAHYDDTVVRQIDLQAIFKWVLVIRLNDWDPI